MRKALLLLAAVACLGFPFHAFSADGIEDKILSCSKIESDNDRIKCYDDIAKGIPVYDDDKENWSITREESKIDGRKEVYYTTESIGKIPNIIGRMESARLILRCQNNETDALVSWPASISSFDSVSVTYKIDENPVKKEQWNPASGLGNAAFSHKPIDFIASISTAEKIIFRIGTEEAEFYVDGAGNAMEEISLACSWKREAKKQTKK